MGACPSNFVHTAILNLAINAHNAMPHGEHTRRVALETRERGEVMAKLTLWKRP